MYNWFVSGHDIDPEHWYFKPEEGGRVLGNLCHWTDFILRLVPEDRRYPIRINPTRATRSDSNIVVTYEFADGTIAVISFSAKGHTFEGVRECFNAHKGNCLIAMNNYRTLNVDVGHVKTRYFNWHRDHGHERNILKAFESLRTGVTADRDAQMAYVWDTGCLFLKTREALETNKPLVVESFSAVKPMITAHHFKLSASGMQ
jgi:predicted dehydrogenase